MTSSPIIEAYSLNKWKTSFFLEYASIRKIEFLYRFAESFLAKMNEMIHLSDNPPGVGKTRKLNAFLRRDL